jgi:hypothetical protein
MYIDVKSGNDVLLTIKKEKNVGKNLAGLKKDPRLAPGIRA